MNRAPRVSVVMAAYNSRRYVRETIESVLAQTMPDFELIVIDDGSSDDTVDIVGSYDDDRIRLVENGQNRGISITRNRGIELSRGDYMAAIDHDDIWLPEKLAAQVAFLDAHPDHVLAATAAKCLEEDGLSDYYAPITNPYVLHFALFTRCPLIHASICIRLASLREHDIRYLQEYHYAEDYELYHRLAEIGRLTCLPARLTIKREHENTTSRLCDGEMTANGQRFLRAAYERLVGSVGEDDIAGIWRLATLGHAAADEAQLQRFGALLSRCLDAYVGKYRPPPEDTRRIREFASELWWRAVSTTAKQLGPPLLRCYGDAPALTARPPTMRERARTRLVSHLGPRVVGTLRPMLRQPPA